MNKIILTGLAGLIVAAGTALAQGTAFTYQGRLVIGTNGANGIYDLRFGLFNAVSAGTQIGPLRTNSQVAVSNGFFAVSLDFTNGAFPGADRWLEIGVRTNGNGTFTTLTPRQKITPTPYAVMAAGVSSSGIAGTYGNAINFNNVGNSFSGDGSDLTGLSASQLSGTVPDARLSANVARLNSDNEFTGANAFTGFNVFTGARNAFTGELVASGGLRLWDGNLSLRTLSDTNHGLGWYGIFKPFANNSTIDGPVLFGYGGGALGTKQFATENIALHWNSSGSVGIGTNAPQQQLSLSGGMNIDQAELNNGSIGNGLRFGSGSGEGIGSKRTGGGNQYGLDFYTDFSKRMSILQNGNVGIGTPSPQAKLDVNGNASFRNMSGVAYAQGDGGNGVDIYQWIYDQVGSIPISGTYPVDNVVFNAPASGFVFVSAFLRISADNPVRDFVQPQDSYMELKLFRGNQELVRAQVVDNVLPGKKISATLHVSWVIPVSAGNLLDLTTKLYVDNNGHIRYYAYGHNLSAIYLPVQY